MRRFAAIIALLALLGSLAGCGGKARSVPQELKIAVISDVHYTGAGYAYIGSFQAANDVSGTGKQVKYLPFILDAFIAQMLRERPDILLVTGDNAFNGARSSHEELAEKLSVLVDSGITVLTLPGNHDINARALDFPDGEIHETVSVSAEEFAEIYAAFGYSAAASRDPSSLSYMYDTGRGVRIFMLDTCFRYGAMYGRVNEGVMEWLSRELEECRRAGDLPLVAGHHNALDHSALFGFGYTVDNSDTLRELLVQNGATLYLSGHLHPQSIVSDGELTDAATECFAVFPHRYGLIEISSEGWRYTAMQTDVEGYASYTGAGDDALLNYGEYGYAFFYSNAYAQAEEYVAAFDLGEDDAKGLCDLIAQANAAYFMGQPSAIDRTYAAKFTALGGGSFWQSYILSILDTPDSLCAEGVWK